MKQIIIKTIGFLLNFTSFFSSTFAGKMAIQLFSRPQNGKLTDPDTSVLKSATKKIFHYNEIAIMTYHWEGSKNTVLLAHGWESNSSRWKDMIPFLKAADLNIIALDAPAHGLSSGKLFNALLFSECIHIVAKAYHVNTVIGHSVGGMAAVFFQHKYQLAHVEKLVLLGAPSNFEDVFDRYAKMMGYHQGVIKAMNEYVLKTFHHPPSYFSAAKFSKNIKSRGLLFHDKKDRIIPFDDALEFEQYYTNATLIPTTGLGHRLRSDTVNTRILDFLTT